MRFPIGGKIAVFLLALSYAPAHATPEDADKSEERARNAFIDQFSKFTQDKNVQGRARTPDGKVVQGGSKTRYNQDDGLAFQSDLTYHDYSYFKVLEEDQGNGKPPKKVYLQPFISDHGKVSAAGGSSLLERTAFSLDQKLGKQDAQNANKPTPQGVSYKSIYKITTKEVSQPQGGPAANAAPNTDPEETKTPASRWELREEAKPEIEKVGETAAQTILRSAKGEQNANDPQTLGNGVLLRQAAASATQALWNSTLANLSQRRVRSGVYGDRPSLSEGAPRCEDWKAAQMAALNQKLQGVSDPTVRQKMVESIENQTKQCKTLASTPYDTVAPTFQPEDNETIALKSEGVEKEDALQRDSRLQLQVMAQAGKSVTELPSKWKFSKDDEKARMTISYDDNQPKEGALTMKEQLDSYNANLKNAEQGYEDVQKRFPDLQMAKPTDYAIQPGTMNIIDINQPPEAAFEEVGIENKTRTGPAPKTYDQLLKAAQTN